MSQSRRRNGNSQMGPSRTVVSELPLRVVLFLRTSATHGAIRAALKQGGFGATEHAEGCALLERACRYRDAPDCVKPDDEARVAIQILSQWARDHFGRFRATLARFHPAAVELFPRVHGADSAGIVQAFVRLLSWLESAEDPKHESIVQTLAGRGLDIDERNRLIKLTDEATATATCSSGSFVDELRVEQVDADWLALYHWYTDWSATARALIKRKDYRLFLGIGERQPRKILDNEPGLHQSSRLRAAPGFS
jgi:hypothetical protein